jgi:putative ABC transport system permease protein
VSHGPQGSDSHGRRGGHGHASTRVYRWLLHLYPRAFRDRFAPEMIALFAERAASAERSFSGRVTFWRAIAGDVLRSAARERFPARRSFSMGEFGYDMRQAWRAVSRAPALAAFVVLLMALGIGSTTAVFSIVNAVLLRPFPFGDPDRIVMVWERRSPENPRNIVGGHEFPEWKTRSRSFAHMAAIAFDREYDLTGAGEPLKLVAARVTSDFFPVMGVAPQLGRPFTADEDRPGNGLVTVISDGLWRARFDADPAIAGRAILLNGVSHTVVGVMPPDFQFPQGAGGAAPDIWTPIAEPIQLYRGRHFLWVVARLRDGVTVAQAQSEMDAIAGGIEKEMPQFSRGHGANVQPLHGEIVQQFRRALIVLFAGVALVLLIACCNVANLLLARAAGRQQEIAVRIALGAGRLRVARQLLAEGAVLAALGGGAGVLIALWLVALARSSFPRDIVRLQNAHLDVQVLAFAAGVSVVTALVFGLVPLGQAMRVHVADRLKHGSKGVARPIRQPLRRALIIAEVALTMALATGAGLLLKSLNRLLHVDPGFQTSGVTAVDLALPAARYRPAASQRAFFDEAVARVRALPGVDDVAATSLVPQGSGRSGIAIAVEGRPAPAPGEELSASYRVVTPDYFKVLGIPLVGGRGFTAQDARRAVPLIRWFPQQPLPVGFDEPQAAPAAVINQSMARAFWPGADPIGRRFTVLFSPPITVVGVVRDSRNRALYEEAGAEFYLSHAQEPVSKMTLVVRAFDTGSSLPAALRATVWSIDRDLPVSNVRALADVVEANLSLFRAITSLMGAFAVMALVLMTLGVYAVVSYTTAQRTYEIGVRIALGAQRGEIRRLVVVNGIGLTAAGIVIGLGGAYGLARFASNMLYEVTPSDPLTYGALAALVLGITMLATWGPARRAQRVDPVTVLRNE